MVKEIRAIVTAWRQAVSQGKRTALATVVHVDGSSYRRPGARMLVTDEGEMTGAISGGCLEGDALRKALLVLTQQQPKLVTYDTRDEEDAIVGRQLGCEGVIQVLFEPIDPLKPLHPIVLLERIGQNRSYKIIVTVFSLADKTGHQPGSCLLWENDLELGEIPDGLSHADLEADVLLTQSEKNSRFVDYGNGYTLFFEWLPPAISLIVAGAGNDAAPVLSLASMIGWEVQLVDGRATHARANRFEASCQIWVGKPEQVMPHLVLDDRTAVLLLTHNYQYDLAMLRSLIDKNFPYLGVLGPAKKMRRMLDVLEKGGMIITDSMLEKIHGPTGLDLGAETPEEIALSMLAEIQKVINERTGNSLRDRASVIHDRSETLIRKKR